MGPGELERLIRAPPGSSGPCERPSEAEAGSSSLCERPNRSRSGLERQIWSARKRPSGLDGSTSSVPPRPSGPERPIRAPQQGRSGSKPETSAGAVFLKRPGGASSHFERSGDTGACPSGHFERFGGTEPRPSCHFERPGTGAGSSSHFGRSGGNGATPSGPFERPSEAEGARSEKRRQVLCFRGRQGRVKLRTACGACQVSYGNFELEKWPNRILTCYDPY